MAMYIRVKRHKTTYFVTCDPTDPVIRIKQKLQTLTDEPADKQRLILLSTDEILENFKTLAEQKVENDAVVALTLQTGWKFIIFIMVTLAESFVLLFFDLS